VKNLPIGDMGDPLLRDTTRMREDLEAVAAGDRYQRDVCRLCGPHGKRGMTGTPSRALFCTISTETRLARTITSALQTTLSRASEPASLSSAL
jgi:hypothetical protein